MLCQFTFSNFRSYKDEIVFNMQATSMKEFENSLITYSDKQSFLPVAVVYGPNAGGKSNLYYALEYVCQLVSAPISTLMSGESATGSSGSNHRCSPFLFDDVSSREPSVFEIYFRKNGYEYRYALVVLNDHITYEALHRRKFGGSRTALLFSREGDEIELGPSLKRPGISKKFNPAIPYLSFLYMNTDCESIADAAEWFINCTFLNYNSAYLETALEQILKDDDSAEITKLLKSVDIRIEGFRTEKIDANRDIQRVYVNHDVGGHEFELQLADESAGTQKMLGLAGFLLNALKGGYPLFVDELDAKLHPKLLRFVTMLFKSPEYNKYGAQLIFTSQDVSTMRNDVFRRDEIWFAAKDEEESSQLWSLADIHETNGNLVSKNAAFDKQYLAGRYGADPYLSRMEAWEDNNE
jgi:hypothetical protein